MFSLTHSVGRTGGNDPVDVRKIEIVLGNTGHLDLTKTDGPTGYFGGRLEHAIKNYQKDENLKSDGHINPNGETMAELNKPEPDDRKVPKKERRQPHIIPPKPGETGDVHMNTEAIAPGTKDKNEVKKKRWLWPREDKI